MTALLLTILVKASLIMAATAAVALLSRRASAATRHLIWTVAILTLLALPLLSTLLPGLAIPVAAKAPVARIAAAIDEGSRFVPVSARKFTNAPAPAAGESESASAPQQRWPWSAILIASYLAGVLMLSIKLVVERLAVRRLTEQAAEVTDADWTELAAVCRRDTGVTGAVRLLRSIDRTMPMAFGVLKPTVLIPSVADTWSADRRRAVLLHELAHIARRDCLTQLVTRIACALYWPHPGTWLIARRLRAEREVACDDRVLTIGTAAPDYAQHLLELAYSLGGYRAPALVVSMARPKQLEGRMLAVLDHARNRTTPAVRLRVAASLVAGLIVLPLAAARISATPEAATYIGENGAAILPGGAAPVTLATAAPDQTRTTRQTTTRREIQWPGTWQLRQSERSTRVQLNLSERRNSMSGFDVPLDQLKGLSSAALTGAGGPVQFSLRRDAGTINFEGTIRSGVGAGTFTFTPNAAFADELSKRGYGRPENDELYVLARNDIGTAFLDELSAQKYTRPSLDQLLRAGDHGVDLDYLHDMGASGYHLGEIEALIRTRDHGVDGEFIGGLKTHGLDGLTVEELVKARDHGVDPDYIAEMKSAGYDLGDIDGLIRARDHGIDADYVKGMGAHGFKKMPLDHLIKARDHGVDVDYIADMRRHGYDLDIDALINGRDHGVDADFVADFIALGYKNLTMGELIRLRDHGVSASWAKRQVNVIGKMSVDDLIRRRDRGGEN